MYDVSYRLLLININIGMVYLSYRKSKPLQVLQDLPDGKYKNGIIKKGKTVTITVNIFEKGTFKNMCKCKTKIK